MRARDRERAARHVRVARLHSCPRGSRGASSVEYGLLIALIAAVLCIGIGVTVKSMFEGALTCFISNLQGVTDPACLGPDAGGDGGGGGGGIVPGITPAPSPSPSPSPSPTATP